MGCINLTMFRGNDFSFDVIVSFDDQPFDLTGSKMFFAGRLSYQDKLLFEKTSDAGEIIFTDPVNGKARINLVPADTAMLSNNEDVILVDLTLTDSLGRTYTVASGTIKVKPVAIPTYPPVCP